jgi:hypothetical protein
MAIMAVLGHATQYGSLTAVHYDYNLVAGQNAPRYSSLARWPRAVQHLSSESFEETGMNLGRIYLQATRITVNAKPFMLREEGTNDNGTCRVTAIRIGSLVYLVQCSFTSDSYAEFLLILADRDVPFRVTCIEDHKTTVSIQHVRIRE